jgi:tetratricopeptide (TPR) repeat protein
MANNYAHLSELEKAEEHILRYLHRNEDGLFTDEAEELLDYVCYELERGPQPLNMNRELNERHEKARDCLERGQFVRATTLLEKLIDDYPDFMAARNNLSLAYYYMGQFNDALRVMDDVFHYEPANLHALCNLAIFYSHQSQAEKAKPIIDGLKKVQPLHIDHCYKLATTLGILKEDERAFELFLMLSKKGMDRDPCLFHYLAVASFNTGRWLKARECWCKVRDLDAAARPVPAPELHGRERRDARHVRRARDPLLLPDHLPAAGRRLRRGQGPPRAGRSHLRRPGRRGRERAPARDRLRWGDPRVLAVHADQSCPRRARRPQVNPTRERP